MLAERYRVDRVLGEGGMALVFEGHHLGLDRPIAIKVLKPAFVAEPQVRVRFEREARAVSRLEHPGIVQMYDVGTTELQPLLPPIAYLVMERLRGQELSDLLTAPLPPEEALRNLEAVLNAVEHAHSRGIVHRDLKPDNIFVCETAAGPQLKLVDFGIAKMVESSGAAPLTQMGMIFGTPPYMSPEQATGMPVDGRTDLYSAGIIFYEMLAGRLPFIADDMMKVLRMQVNASPPPPARVVSGTGIHSRDAPDQETGGPLPGRQRRAAGRTRGAQGPLGRRDQPNGESDRACDHARARCANDRTHVATLVAAIATDAPRGLRRPARHPRHGTVARGGRARSVAVQDQPPCRGCEQ